MPKTSLFPPNSRPQAEALKLSPGIVSNGHVFLTGVTGSLPDGCMPFEPETQFRSAFDKIGEVLAQAGLDHSAIVEMTTYHIGMEYHFDLFETVRAQYVQDPFPAWTAIEVAGLRRSGALVEIRVVAAL
ncbi:MAG: RidA family protein [Aliishimia sp.]